MRLLKALLFAAVLSCVPATINSTWLPAVQTAQAVEVDLQFLKGTKFLDSTGAVLSSGTINIYDSGTTDLRTTYSERTGTTSNTLNGSDQIVLDSSGALTESVYIPTGAWKFVLKDSSGNTIVTEDNIEGALDTSAFTVTSAAPELDVITKTSDYTVTTSDLGKCINADPTGGNFTLTLLSASSAGDGKTLCIRHNGTSGRVTVTTTSSQTINGKTSFVLTATQQVYWIVSDGANWHVISNATPVGSQLVIISDRLTSPPSSTTTGNCYIINGTPTGAWSAYSQHDVVCATGTGTWSKYTPADGWLGYVTDETMLTQYRTSAWVDLSAITAPSTQPLRQIILRHTTAQNVSGGAATTTAWTKRTLNTTDVNTITTDYGASGDATISSSVVTLPAGTYEFEFMQNFSNTADYGGRVRDTSNNSTISHGTSGKTPTNTANQHIYGVGRVTVSSATTFELQYYASATGSNEDLGYPSNISGVSETYAFLKITDLASLQGPQGETGAQGSTGFAGFKFDYSSVTAIADPTTGVVRFNNSTLTSATQAAIDYLSADTGNPSVMDELLSWDNSTSSNKGTLKVSKVGAHENYFTYTLTAITDSSGYLTATLTPVTGAGSFSNGDDIALEFIEKGDKGDTATITVGTVSTGAAGSSVTITNSGTSTDGVFDFTIPRGDTGVSGPTIAVRYDYSSTTTDSDPGSGILRLNSGTLSAATQVYFDNNELNGTDVSTWLDTFDDTGTSGNRGTLLFVDPVTSTIFHLYSVSETVTDGTGYRKVTVAHLAGNGSFTNGSEVSVFFMPRGQSGAGDVTGPGSSTDNAIAAWNGTNGDTLENTAITHDGAGGISLTAITATGNINTTAGKVKENSVNISPIGKKTIYIPAGSMMARTTNGCALSSVSETTTNKVLMRTLDCDASTNEYFQFQFAAPASFNLSTVTYQAYWFHATTATNFGVVWGLQCQGLGDGDTIDTAFGTAITVADTGGNTDRIYISPESSALTIANVAAGDLVQCQGFREAVGPSDTMTIDARFVGLKFLYTSDAATDD